MRSLSHSIHSINRTNYKIDTSGVAGLFGGEAAVDALTAIHLYAGRKWVGWYNYPGSQSVAVKFGKMAKTQLWDTFFPGPNEPPAITFGFAAEPGPNYNGSYSGTKLTKTSYLGYLAVDKCADLGPKELQLFDKDGNPARKTRSATVAIISLPSKRQEKILQSQTAASVSATKPDPGLVLVNPKRSYLPFFAILPSLVSILASILCLIGDDTLCAALIILGVVNGGLSSLALGTATLWIRVPVPSPGSPPGDGLMYPADGSNIVILKGEEADVNIITKGEFELDYSAMIYAGGNYHLIGLVSLCLQAQSLLQLLLLSLVTFFGQIMYLASLVASGSYHLYVISNERKRIHQELLFHELASGLERWSLGTRTQMAVFVCLCVGDGRKDPHRVDYDAILKSIIPNDTPVWRRWRIKVLEELKNFWKPESLPYVPRIHAGPKDKAAEDDPDQSQGFEDEDQKLLENLIGDAWCVFNGYLDWRNTKSQMSGVQPESTDEKAVLSPGGSIV